MPAKPSKMLIVLTKPPAKSRKKAREEPDNTEEEDISETLTSTPSRYEDEQPSQKHTS